MLFSTVCLKIPASFSFIVLNRSKPRLRFNLRGLSWTSSFNAFSTSTVCSIDWNVPFVYISHILLAASSLERRNVEMMEPFSVLTNTAPWGRC